MHARVPQGCCTRVGIQHSPSHVAHVIGERNELDDDEFVVVAAFRRSDARRLFPRCRRLLVDRVALREMTRVARQCHVPLVECFPAILAQRTGAERHPAFA